jgi:hypothetical protein
MTAESPSEQARSRIQAAYDPTLLRETGHLLVELVSDHMAHVQSGSGAVLPWQPPPDLVREAAEVRDRLPPAGTDRPALIDRFRQLVATMLGRGLNLHHPHYIGHQVPAPVPIAGWFDALGSVTNQCMAIYDMGPWATAAEQAMVERLGEQIGWRAGEFSGVVTHGGSLANFTALLTARNVALPDFWERGMTPGSHPPVLVVQGDAHYCVSRSAGMLGLGTQHVVRVGLDSQRRMDPNRLDEILADLRPTEPADCGGGCVCLCHPDRRVRSVGCDCRGVSEARSLVARRRGARWLCLLEPAASAFGFGFGTCGQSGLGCSQDAVRPRVVCVGIVPRSGSPLRDLPAGSTLSVRPVSAWFGRIRQRDADGRMHQASRSVRAVGRLVDVWAAVAGRPGRCHLRDGPCVVREAAGDARIFSRCTSRSAISSFSDMCRRP